MAGSIAKLVVSLGANVAGFETDIKRATQTSKRELAKMERQAKKLNDTWNRNFKLAGAAVATGLVLATKAAADFEKSMAEVSTLLDDTSGLDNLAKGVKQVAIEFGNSPNEEAKALYQIISAGASDAASQMEQLTVANQLAVGGVTDVATAADGLTTVLNAYAGQGLSAQAVSDTLFTAMKGGKTTIEQLSQGIGNVATIASQTGVSFDELGAAVATLTKSGISTSQSMDSLRGILAAVLKQSPQAVKAAKDMGVEFNIAAIESKGFAGWLETIVKNEKVTSEGLAKMFGRVEALNAVMALGGEEMAEFNRQLEEQANKAGTTEVAVSKMMETTAQKAARAQAAFEVLGIEIGQRFLAAVSDAAEVFVNNIDKIAAAIEALIILLGTRLVITAAASFGAMAANTTALASAMAILGGPVGVVALAFAGLLVSLDRYQQHMLAMQTSIKVTTGFLLEQADAADAAGRALVNQQIIDKARQLKDAYAAVKKEYDLLAKKLKQEQESWFYSTLLIKTYQSELDNLGGELKSIERLMKAYNKKVEENETLTEVLVTTTKKSTKAFEAHVKALTKAEKAAAAAAKKQQFVYETALLARDGQNRLSEATQQLSADMSELDREVDRYEQSVQSVLDVLFPTAKATQELDQKVKDLTQSFMSGSFGLGTWSAAMQVVMSQFALAQTAAQDTADEFDLMTTAIDEGARILERSFATMWSNITSGADDAFDTVLDGFKSLLDNMIHQATTRQITMNIQQGLAGTGSGPGGGINWQQLGGDLAKFAAVIAGSQIGGGGQGAGIGSALGGLVGEAAFAKFFPALFTKLGLLGGPIGTAIGAVLGGLLGGLFDKERPVQLNASGNLDWAGLSSSDTENVLKTIFGDTFITSRRADPGAIQEVMQGITEFDKALASFLNSDQIGAISDALKTWDTHLTGDAITLESLLNSRFKTVLSTFTTDIQDFVNRGIDLADQMSRLEVGVAAQNIIDAAPDLFAERTVNDFLNVVEAFRDGTQTITEAFNEVLELLNIVTGAVGFLSDYAGSDLGADYQTLLDTQGLSLSEALTGMYSGLSDAITNFDGSPEQLQNIASMVASVREGELKLLQQIDSIQKGIAANLASLRDDLLGVVEGPKDRFQLIGEAEAALGALSTASTAEEVAALAAEFEVAIRAMSPEDQASFGRELINLVDLFQSKADERLEVFRQDALSAAESARGLIDEFVATLGDPLQFITDYNERQADALDVISETMISKDDLAEQGAEDREMMGVVMADGLSDISGAVGSIGPQVASAVRAGFSNIQIVVQQPQPGLVNE